MKTFKHYDKFDIACALYHWLQHNWGSQGDSLYGSFCHLTASGNYRPDRSEEFWDNVSDRLGEIYYMITRQNCDDLIEYCLNGEGTT